MTTATRTAHPTAPLPPAALSAMARIEFALAAPEREAAAKVAKALGFHTGWKPATHLGETATRIIMWSQVELNTVFERVGGTVTTQQMERSTSDGSSTWTATEITVTVTVPGVGEVGIVTDWDEEIGGWDLPVMVAATRAPAIVRAVAVYETAAVHRSNLAELAAAGELSDLDAEGFVVAEELMAGALATLTAAGMRHLVEAA
ncbi:hypothetical protein [Streptomyces triticiradicis]|uniref:Uncharacterized protein n=1 Tax=Streptomyces triticiradicis TaxID=2651189 RepID=A0A7J5D5G0_9ACTN|nr:hypothetical protein [Streptomyces triticiradicis]KAB1979474.1 hypothetical protein F8144_36290 [Streptomyces triticiradicis]